VNLLSTASKLLALCGSAALFASLLCALAVLVTFFNLLRAETGPLTRALSPFGMPALLLALAGGALLVLSRRIGE
jgi:hypothetical protein